MGQYALIFAASIFVTSSIVMSEISSDVSRADQAVNHRYAKLMARDASMTGYQLVTLKLAQDPDPWIDVSAYSRHQPYHRFEGIELGRQTQVEAAV